MRPEQKEEFKRYMGSLYKEIKKSLQIKTNPKVFLVDSKDNANKILGKTAFYEKNSNVIKLYITDRLPKDILRSFSHECIHHYQNENGRLNSSTLGNDPKYAQNDPILKKAEEEAYQKGNMIFRNWEDSLKYGS